MIHKNLFALAVLLFCRAFCFGEETAEGVFPEENAGAATPVWRQAPGGALMGVPDIQAGTVVAALDGGHLKAYSLEGRPLWDYYAGGKLIPFVTRTREGTCYTCRTDGTLVAVNRSGRELWRLKTGIITAPVVAGWDGRIFVTTEKYIRCYTASGCLLWQRDLEHPAAAGPFLTGRGGLAAALSNGELLELNPFGKPQSWHIGEVPAALLPVEGGILAVLKKGELKLFRDTSAFPRSAGTIRGTPLGGVSRGAAAAFLLSSGKVVQVSLSNGKQRWSTDSHIGNNDIKSPADFSMIWDERGIYVFSRKGATGFNAEGRRLWLLRLSGASSIPVLSDEGTLFSGGVDWILYAYKVENRVRPPRRSLYGPAPEGDYGLVNPPASPWAGDYYRFSEARMNEEMARLTALIRGGQVGENEPNYAAYLREITGSSTNPQTSLTHPPVHVQHRAEAARLLGYFGSRETLPFLADLYSRDPDPLVKTAAAEAIGRIGTDPDGIALKAFAQFLTTANRDEQVLTATAGAIGSLCRFSGPPLSDSGVKLLGILERDFMPAKVRSRARQEIDALR
ncbi:MAG: PQQ-binding-like beta-propeller repeat protein [Spirochaetaceae bacterium]|jgi:outer membrane protein assembly factor BamB|nr:PQQ-binding-like beta-propeller repeat protein [Spirochaetaceae bacterium]